jgi:serine O-acetyltransferase
MTFRETINDLRWDLERYHYRLHQSKLAIILLFPGFQAVAMYRVSRWLDTRSKMRYFWWWPIIVLEAIATRITEIITGIYISPMAQLGAGLLFPHFGGIYIGKRTVLGRNCDIYQGVTIGYNVHADESGYPVVGDRAFVAAGAKIFGPIQIGNDVAVGANAVVTKPAPDHAVVLGIPGKAHSYAGSFDLIRYPGWETDPDRQASLQQVQPSS